MGKISDFFASVSKEGSDYLKRFNDGDFVNGLAATAALVSAADGQVEQEERSRIGTLFARDPLFEPFDKKVLAAKFNEYALDASDDVLRHNVLEIAVKGAKGNVERAEKMLRVAVSIANADGEFEDAEKKVVRELATRLSLQPSAFGV